MSRIAIHTLPARYQTQVSQQLHGPKIALDAAAERNAKLSKKGRKAQTVKAAMRDAKGQADREWLEANAHCGEWVTEHLFANDGEKPRKWRFDFACLSRKVAVEVDGGVWSGGAHGRGWGIARDMEKGNEATARGWRVIRVMPKELRTPETLALISRCCTANILLP
jgi:very-short-patch-repair endonuclease